MIILCEVAGKLTAENHILEFKVHVQVHVGEFEAMYWYSFSPSSIINMCRFIVTSILIIKVYTCNITLNCYGNFEHVLQIFFLLLFISYKFVKGFLAIKFVLLLISSWNFHACQRFLCNQKQNFSLIRQKLRNFPRPPL